MNSAEKRKIDSSGEWDHLISMPQTRVVEFDPEIRRLSQEDKNALSILISGSKKYRAQSILVGVLMSFLALLLLFLGSVYLVVGEIVTEDSFAFVAIFMLVVWCVLTYLSFRLPSRRCNPIAKHRRKRIQEQAVGPLGRRHLSIYLNRGNLH